MKAALDLRRRLALGLVGLCAGVTASFAALVWVGSAWLESDLLDHLLGRELAIYAEGGRVPPPRDGLLYYRSGGRLAPPPAIAALAPGSYRDHVLDGRRYHILVRELGNHDRAYLLYDVGDFAELERRSHLALLAGFALCALLAWLASGAVARRTLQPLATLVDDIRALPLEGAAARLPHRQEEGELRVIVDAVNGRLAEIGALVARERAFAAAAAHELRTPLAVIANATELAQALPAQRPATDARIERAVERARDTLDALLALSRAQEPPAATVAVDELLQQWASPHLADAEPAGTQVEWVLQPVRRTLPAAVLGIVFSNLLRNALRAAAGGRVRIDLDTNRLLVEDDGEGIAPADLPHVFEPGTHGKHGGSGMGLYIARVLSERQGWWLGVENLAGGGVRATLRFAGP
ncbi:MAG TPA: HAMP domain-containing sensor histidine kinase [Solimonas sp.]|nr:HAMP domain-containing sensor histidine kinase [Solimonas sp.]